VVKGGAGRPAAAEAEARRALALAEGHRERGNLVYARRLLGLAAAEHDPADLPRARAHQREALALAEELGMRPLVARCHLGLGRLARRAGDAAAAERHFREARARLQEMGMTFWLDRLGQDQAAGAPRPEV
jgi:tetratricopeptide (TPR) repeat protein